MSTSLANRSICLPALAGLCFILLGAPRLAGQVVDLNGNGMSDVWELIYGAAALDPAGDADGDGASNLEESIAGTDPFDPNSVPRIWADLVGGTNITISMASAPGKQYQLQSRQSSGNGDGTEWSIEATMVARSGAVVSFNSAAGSNLKLFRIAVSDVDTDGDGVSDWEEYQLGLDPANPYSNGQLDQNGVPIGDYAFVVGKLAMQDVVTISATAPIAVQPDPGQSALVSGQLTLSRGGFPLNSLTVNLGLSAPGPGAALEGVDFQNLPQGVFFPVSASSQTIQIVPLANTNLQTPAVATMSLLAGAGYRLGSTFKASIVIYPSTSPAGFGLAGQYFLNASAAYSSSANFNPTNLALTRIDPSIDFSWATASDPITNRGFYSVRWVGQVEPQYSETYFFDANTHDGVKLWVNDQLIINRWAVQNGSADSIGSITLLGGTRYNIRMEYFNAGGAGSAHLYWYSASQPKQVIPAKRLYPTTTSAPTALTSSLTAVGFLGQPFEFSVTSANSGGGYTAIGLPPGLGLDPGSGLISGTPAVAGDYQVTLTATNAAGLAASVLDLQVFDTGSAVVREVWVGVSGTNVADIPVNQPPTTTSSYGALEGFASMGQNYGERIRGYFTAPSTGNYYFWLAASDAAELWISNNDEPVNKVRRAFVSPDPNLTSAGSSGTAVHQWDLQPNQRSPWLALNAGQKYYVEILHKAGADPTNHWAVGWCQDPSGITNLPTGIVPSYLLSRYFPRPASAVPGTLYTANLLANAGVSSDGVGSASLRVSADGSQAVLKFKFSGLSSPVTGRHIYSDTYLSNPSQILFDIDAAAPEPDGSYVWAITPTGTLSQADILELIQESKAYLNIHTAKFPDGEISGHFTATAGTQDFTPPPSPPDWVDDHSNPNAAARFLMQASFGASSNDIAAVQSMGYEAWIDNQFSLPPTYHLPIVLSNASPDPTAVYSGTLAFNAWWRNAVTAPDQLRQRVAFALSEIMVVSQQGVLENNSRTLSAYYDTLLDNAFGNFRSLLEAVTLSPAMGSYLDMRSNDKGSIITGIHPNENYAREIMQLFSIGLNRLWPDGTLVLDSLGELVPTYDQNVIMGFASVFTGWNYSQPLRANGRLPTIFNPHANYVAPMVLVPTHHELGTKLVLDNVMLPPAQGGQADPTNPAFDAYCSHDLDLALDSIFYHQNVGPFVCRQLMQRLVTSNPSRGYLYRVVEKFNDNGSGERGDLQAVIKAILLDYEARDSASAAGATFGKQREPLLRITAVARAFPAPQSVTGVYSQAGSRAITITTAAAHRLNTGDTVELVLTDTSGEPVPPSQGYSVTVTSPTTFRINATGVASGTYGQTNSINTVTISGHGLAAGDWAYLVFTTGGASNGVYDVVTVPDSSHFTVTNSDNVTHFGGCVLPKLTGGGYSQVKTNLTFSLPVEHGLQPGDSVFVHFGIRALTNGVYQVQAVADAKHLAITVTNSANRTRNGEVVYPLVPPPLNRSGNALVQWSTFSVGATDTGGASLSQTPLNSPTVFNFFLPEYRFPGVLASAGLTTPEFQLTSDTTTAQQMNLLEGGILNNAGNTNGLSSFIGGQGAIVLDLGSWMTAEYTSDAGVPGLVDALNTLLCAGHLSANAKDVIVKYVANAANFAFATPPTATQMRDRVRAVVHLVVTSPDFTIQN